MDNNKPKQSILSKSSNLVKVDSRNNCVFTSYSPNHISISKYVTKSELNNFFNLTTDNIQINLFTNESEIKQIFENVLTYEEFVELAFEYDFPLSVYKKKLLASDFDYNKHLIIKDFIIYANSLKSKFLAFERSAKQNVKFNGTRNLYLTRYFLKGITPIDKQILKAPIILIPIEIINSNGILYIYKKDEIEINEKLIVFLQREFDDYQKSLTDLQLIPKNFENLKKILEEITSKEIETKCFDDDLRFKKETKSMVEKEFKDQLFIDDCVCMGFFEPGGGKLKEDLINIINRNQTDIFNIKPVTFIDEVKNEEAYNIPLIQISKLDIYQRYAVRSALKDNTVIYGPPGTGKSEVITNFIANVLFNNKTALIASEKTAALNVIGKRLSNLNIFLLEIFDLNNHKSFYDSIVKLAEFLGNSWIIKSEINNPILNSDIDKINSYINDAAIFKRIIIEFDNLTNYKVNNYSFLDFLNEVNKIGNLSDFNYIITNNIIEKIEKFNSQNNFNNEILFTKLNLFTNFIKENKLEDEIEFNEFFNQTKTLNQIVINTNLLIDKNQINFNFDNTSKLNEFFLKFPSYQAILRGNISKIYNDINKINTIIKNCSYLLNKTFFENIYNAYIKTKQFINVFKNIKESDKKYVLDTFVNEQKIIDKKPFNKLFSNKRLNANDEIILENLYQFNLLNLDEYEDFNYIYNIKEIFHPLLVACYFNNEIVSYKKIDFISKDLFAFDYSWYLLQKQLNIDLNKWMSIKKINLIYQSFADKFNFFLQDSLFIEFFNNYKNIKWDEINDILVNMLKNKILSNLTNLPNETKNLIAKAIEVARSSKPKELYEYLLRFAPVLKFLFPIWVSRPDQIANFVPLTNGFFDYGIYDEASQMFLERAYPLLYRCKTNIISGDDKQLKPSSFFMSRNYEDEAEFDVEDLDVVESLLDRAKATSWTIVMLKNHYRCKTKDLIEFSSNYIYDNQLNYASLNGLNNTNSLQVFNVEGYFIDNINTQEANKVIELLEKNYQQFKSIIVIAFNINQSQLIQSMLMDTKLISADLFQKYMNQEIEVVNLENVQGNEADLVILSIGYAKKSDNEKLHNYFGPINLNGGLNRLNVAITRAKSKMLIVKSFYANEINLTDNPNILMFKKYIAYLDSINENTNSLDDLINLDNKFDSEFEQEVYEELNPLIKQKNLQLLTQYSVGSKKIDLAILDKNLTKVILGVEVDGWKYHHGVIKMHEDLERQIFLESRGYPIFRILEHEWKRNKQIVITTLFLYLDKFENISY